MHSFCLEKYLKIRLTGCDPLLDFVGRSQNLQKKAIMKLTNKTLTWLVAGMVSIVLAVGANAQTAKDRTGKVVRIKGAARYSTGNKTWQPLKVGTILKSGAIVQTAADSYVDIVLNEDATASAVSMPRPATSSTSAAAGGGGGGSKAPEHDVIRLQEDSALAIDRVAATDTGVDRVTVTELDLRSGSVFCSVKKQAAASRFEVKIPNGIAGIRGTYALIFADGRVICGTGSVVSSYTDSTGKTTTKVVPAGNQLDNRTGEMGPVGSAVLGRLEILSQNVSYGYSPTPKDEFLRYQNLGREHMSNNSP